jgi:hypothetical protein
MGYQGMVLEKHPHAWGCALFLIHFREKVQNSLQAGVSHFHGIKLHSRNELDHHFLSTNPSQILA